MKQRLSSSVGVIRVIKRLKVPGKGKLKSTAGGAKLSPILTAVNFYVTPFVFKRQLIAIVCQNHLLFYFFSLTTIYNPPCLSLDIMYSFLIHEMSFIIYCIIITDHQINEKHLLPANISET